MELRTKKRDRNKILLVRQQQAHTSTCSFFAFRISSETANPSDISSYHATSSNAYLLGSQKHTSGGFRSNAWFSAIRIYTKKYIYIYYSVTSTRQSYQSSKHSSKLRMYLNPLALELDIYSLAHHFCKMWIFYEPRRVTLGNTRYSVEE